MIRPATRRTPCRPRSPSSAASSDARSWRGTEAATPSPSTRPRSTPSSSSAWWRRAVTRSPGVSRGGRLMPSVRPWPSCEDHHWPTWSTTRSPGRPRRGWRRLGLDAHEGLVEAELASGRHAEVVPVLTDLVWSHPLRERFHSQLILALYRCGRQADALRGVPGGPPGPPRRARGRAGAGVAGPRAGRALPRPGAGLAGRAARGAPCRQPADDAELLRRPGRGAEAAAGADRRGPAGGRDRRRRRRQDPTRPRRRGTAGRGG